MPKKGLGTWTHWASPESPGPTCTSSKVSFCGAFTLWGTNFHFMRSNFHLMGQPTRLHTSETFLKSFVNKSPQIASSAVLPSRDCRNGPAHCKFIALVRAVTAADARDKRTATGNSIGLDDEQKTGNDSCLSSEYRTL